MLLGLPNYIARPNCKWESGFKLRRKITTFVRLVNLIGKNDRLLHYSRGTNIRRTMNITSDHLFLNVHNPFTNERMSVYLDKHSRMSLLIK